MTNGRIEMLVSPSSVTLQISLPGYAQLVIGPKPAIANEILDLGELTLNSGDPWDLLVEDSEGAPVPQAIVKYHTQRGLILGQVTTDEAGRAVIPHTAETHYLLSVHAPGFIRIPFHDYQPQKHETTTIVLKSAKPTTGIVCDQDGDPVPGVRLERIPTFGVLEGEFLTTTDAAGRFLIEQVNGPGIIQLKTDGKLRQIYAKVGVGETDLQWKLLPSLTLAGQVVGISQPSQSLLAGELRVLYTLNCVVQNGTWNVKRGSVSVDSLGNFQIESLIPGTVYLTCQGRSFSLELKESRDDVMFDFLVPDPNQPHELLKLEFVSGGQPVKLNGTLTYTVSSFQRRSVSFNEPVKNADTLEINTYSPGFLALTSAGLEGYCLAGWSQQLQVAKNQKTLRVDLVPAGVLTGVLLDDDGEPVPNASIRLEMNETFNLRQMLKANMQGEYLFSPVPLNEIVTITAEVNNQVISSKRVRLRAVKSGEGQQ